MREIQEQTRSAAETVKQEREPEKKPAEIRTTAAVPEIAAAAVSAVEKSLGIAVGRDSAEKLLSGGNQLLLGLLKSQAPETDIFRQTPDFSEAAPENDFVPDGADADLGEIPGFSGSAIAITPLSTIG